MCLDLFENWNPLSWKYHFSFWMIVFAIIVVIEVHRNTFLPVLLLPPPSQLCSLPGAWQWCSSPSLGLQPSAVLAQTLGFGKVADFPLCTFGVVLYHSVKPFSLPGLDLRACFMYFIEWVIQLCNAFRNLHRCPHWSLLQAGSCCLHNWIKIVFWACILSGWHSHS